MATIAGALIVAGGAVYAANAASKAQKKAAATQRNTGDELSTVTGAAPGVFKSGRENDYLAGLGQQSLNRRSAHDALDLYPQVARAERMATHEQRADDVRDIARFGPGLQAHLDNLNPGWREASDSLSALLSGARENSPLLNRMNQQALGDGLSPINQRLQDYGLSELALGGQLSPDEIRQVQQDARGEASARGVYGSDLGSIEEILNLDSARRGRAVERAGLAQGIQSGLLSEITQDRGFAQGVEGLNQQELAGDRAFVLNDTSVQQNRLGPLLSILAGGRAGVQPGNAAGLLYSGPNTVGSSAGTLASVLGYGNDVANTNYNGAQARYISQANNAGALGGAVVGAGTKITTAGIEANAQRQKQAA